MSRKENDDFVATKEEKTFDDEGNTIVAELPKSKMKDKIPVKKINTEVKSGVVKIKNSDMPQGKFSYSKQLNKRRN